VSSKHAVPPENVHTFKVGAPDSRNPSDSQQEQIAAGAAAGEQFLSPYSPAGATGGDSFRDDEGISTPGPQTSHGNVLPEYITGLPEHIDGDILQLLQCKGALTVPSRAMIDELLRVFVCYVYPFLPLLDLEILDPINGGDGNSISLLLFQAIMFAGSTFADLSLLQQAGFSGHTHAREALFSRVKLLFEMDIESNPTTLIQVLLLMTYWYGSQNDIKGRFYWLRTAFSLAVDIGLDRPNQFSNQPDRQRSRRRLWYCCITREKLLSITERRAKARGSDGDTVMAIESDDLSNGALAHALNKHYMPGSDDKATHLTRLFVHKVKLCVIIDRILTSQYELSGLRHLNSSETIMVLIPKVNAPDNQAVARDQELRRWYAEVSSLEAACFGQDHRCNGRVIGVHSATLELLYLTALSAVHRPVLLNDQPKDSANGALQAFSHSVVRSAAQRISEIFRHLDEGNLIQFLPAVVVGACIAASIQHLKDALSTDPGLRGTGRLYLSQSIHILTVLQSRYNSATCTLNFIERVRSGKLPYRTFEWEDRAIGESPFPENAGTVGGGAHREEAEFSTLAQRSSLHSTSSPLSVRPQQQPQQHHNARWQRSVGRDLSDASAHSMSGTEGDFCPCPENFEAISEVFLSAPFNADANVDWPSMGWFHDGGLGA
jgi:hypothetical protein